MTRWSYNGFSHARRPTRTVNVGRVSVGSAHPIRVQSMTTPSTRDTTATVDQIERLVDAGCEIVRLTVPTTGDAENLPTIRSEMAKRRLVVPLVADIHFTPAAAMKAIEHVDKVRINPGNYADKKKFAVREYTDAQYEAELARIEEVFSPLVRRAKELGVSMRIGTNHGSLSDRVMNRYGDTPLGMVESALEFVRICEAHDYRELILSMKASNPLVVVEVYRLLAQRMADEGMDYPFHLGVTEAGDGEDGRIKSSIGIGSLLDEGIGDTIRVSLTEDPVAEIPVARALAERHNRLHGRFPEPPPLRRPVVELRDPFAYARRRSETLRLGQHEIGGGRTVLVEVPLSHALADEKALRAELDAHVGVRVPEDTRADVVCVNVESRAQLEALARLKRSLELVAPRAALSARVDLAWLRSASDAELENWLGAAHRLHFELSDLDESSASSVKRLLEAAGRRSCVIVLEVGTSGSMEDDVDLALRAARCQPAGAARSLMLTLEPRETHSPLHAMRLLAARLGAEKLEPPLLLLDRPAARGADGLLGPASCLGGLLCDGIGDSIQIEAGESRRRAFGILQAARVRITRTEFISCPSCGRTLFDLEETTARIKARTAHLKGLKIAVMGCIVNGPGEMADADFGYVGWGEDKIALFVGKEMVVKDVPTDEAEERLVELIKQHGRWVDPPVPAGA